MFIFTRSNFLNFTQFHLILLKFTPTDAKVQQAKDSLMELLMSMSKQSKVMVFVDCTVVLQYLAFVFLFTAAFILDFMTL